MESQGASPTMLQNVHGRQVRKQLGNLSVKQPSSSIKLFISSTDDSFSIATSDHVQQQPVRENITAHGLFAARHHYTSLITIFITSHEVPLGVHVPYLTSHDSRTKAALTKSFKVPLALILCVRALPLAVLFFKKKVQELCYSLSERERREYTLSYTI
jgi:hypothetical protein